MTSSKLASVESGGGPSIRFNGEERTVHSSSVAELIQEFSLSEKRFAVELNREIVPRSAFPTTMLRDGDEVEIVEFVGGG